MMHRAWWGWVAVVVACLACAAPARADDGAGAFRIGLGVDVVDWHTQDWWRSSGGNSHREGYDFTLGTPSFGLQLAGQVTPEIGIGASFGFATARQDETTLGTQVATSLRVQALGEYAAWPGTFARPFVRALVGFGVGDSDGFDPLSGPLHYSVVLFEAGGVVGVHLFPERSLSISPYARIDYAVGPGTETRLLSATATTTSLTTSYVAVSAGVELIAWLGGAAPAPTLLEQAETLEDPAPPPAPTWQGEVLSTRVAFFGGTRGGLVSAEPRSDPAAVRIRFSTTHEELAGCESIEIVTGQARTRVPLEVRERAAEGRTRYVVRFGVTPSTLALLASRRASLEACTRRFELAFDASRAVLSFLAALLDAQVPPPESEVIPPPPTDPEPAAPTEAAPPESEAAAPAP